MPLDYAKTAPRKNSHSALPIEEIAAPIASAADLPPRAPHSWHGFYAAGVVLGLSTRRYPLLSPSAQDLYLNLHVSLFESRFCSCWNLWPDALARRCLRHH